MMCFRTVEQLDGARFSRISVSQSASQPAANQMRRKLATAFVGTGPCAHPKPSDASAPRVCGLRPARVGHSVIAAAETQTRSRHRMAVCACVQRHASEFAGSSACSPQDQAQSLADRVDQERLQKINARVKVPYSTQDRSIGPGRVGKMICAALALLLLVVRVYGKLHNHRARDGTWHLAVLIADCLSSALLSGLLYVLSYLIAGYKAYEQALLPAAELADSDSQFLRVNSGIQLHCKVLQPRAADLPHHEEASTPPLALVLLHGFGAWLFSWDLVQSRLSSMLGATTVSFDRPAFGLTPREQLLKAPSSLRVYSDAFCASAALELAHQFGSSSILVGHSLGAKAALLAAQRSLSQQDGHVKGLVLIAPAIAAPRRGARGSTSSASGHAAFSQSTGKRLDFAAEPFSWPSVLVRVRRSLQLGALLALQTARELMYLFLRRVTPLLGLALRVLVRKQAFWRNGLVAATADEAAVGKYAVAGYSRPDRVQLWDRALAEFTVSGLHRKGSLQELAWEISDMWFGSWCPPRSSTPGSHFQLTAITDAIRAANMPVLVLHGQQDRIVPARNSRALVEECFAAHGYTRCRLVELADAGHMPHETSPDTFVSIVSDWAKANGIGRFAAV
ncbi:hypothetical protein FVE85_8169 [Porphyridium purpureum]|uniref:AB hydrolase-1 domain-containing protein n=1 Tax=Porphyridium purpureum TaxID=35688 RepID=A0A5J4YNW3_PORPP|nr:hypothetical protein FVE85_8169 [Porphyridium purpureum]|eukprot:POR0568..scf295_9